MITGGREVSGKKLKLKLKKRNPVEARLKRERIKDNLLFFAHFLISPAKLGTPLPTTREIGEAIAEELRKAKAKKVIELGAGLGSITGQILEVLDGKGKLLCIEKSPIFCKHLKEKFGDKIIIIEEDALAIDNLIKNTEWEKTDALVCSIPMANEAALELSKKMADVLYPDGLLLQVTNYDSAIRKYFNIERSIKFKNNIPPEKLHIAYPKKESEKKELHNE